MLVDHIGWLLFPEILWLRIVGRLSFPLFCFFIAEGLHYTKNYKKYLLRLFVFVIISQIPYYFATNTVYKLNILFTFLLSILIVKLIEKLNKDKVVLCIYLAAIFLLIFASDFFSIFEYGLYGVLLVLLFYFLKNKNLKLSLASVLMLCYSIFLTLVFENSINNFIQCFAVLSLVLIYFYNGFKGKFNLKYLFYVFYPLHLFILVLIKFLII